MEHANLHISHKDFLELAEDIAGRVKRFSFMAAGTSMSPFIKDGDTVVIAPVGDSVSTGDVVLLKTDGEKLFLHRVIKKSDAGVVTRGDASYNDDGFTPNKNILGRVTKVSGQGFNFHLKTPFKYLIAKRIIYSGFLCRFTIILKAGKKVAEILG